MFNQSNDGQNHINIYSKGYTELGRFLSNFSLCQIITEDGPFKSIEGYWYWLGTRNDTLRKLYGFKTKQVGKTLPTINILEDEVFKTKIRNACWIKIHFSQHYYNLFIQSTLPFKHYYVFNNHIKDAGYKWLIEMWEYFRMFINNKYQHLK